MKKIVCLLLSFAASSTAVLHAQVITPSGITGSGTFYNSVFSTPALAAHVLIDGAFAPESTNWEDPTFDGTNYFNGLNTTFFPAGAGNATATGGTTVWWSGNDLSTGAANPVTFVTDLGSLFHLTRIDLSVDNNDGYFVDYSTDGVVFHSLFAINSSSGTIGWGMDTLSSDPSDPQFDAQLAFSPVNARFLRFGAVAGSGDNLYAMSEVRAFGSLVNLGAVPEPSTYGACAGLVLIGLVGFRGRRRR